MRPSSLYSCLAVMLAVCGPAAAQVVPDFSADVVSGTSPLTVHFTDLTTGTPLGWTWSFGDGGGSTAQNPTHVYGAGGPYTVSLLAITTSGPVSISKTDLVTVTPATIAVDFTSTSTHGVAPHKVFFHDETVPLPTAWTWDFGDGAISHLQHPVHIYDGASPTYDVSLTIELYTQAASKSVSDLVVTAPSLFAQPTDFGVRPAYHVVAADLDGDGDLDVVAGENDMGGVKTIRRYTNADGAGAFVPEQPFWQGAATEGPDFVLADLDSDGDTDFVRVAGSTQLAWQENADGRGTFVPKPAITVISASSVVAADMDGDGDLDLVTGETYGTLAVSLNLDGLGQFGPGQLVGPALAQPVDRIDALDADGDGDNDVAWVTSFFSGPSAYWSENVLGDASTWNVKPPVLDFWAYDVDFADIDGDGESDLVRAPASWISNAFNGAGSVGALHALDANVNADVVEAGDVDLDGDQDLLSAGGSVPLIWHRNLDHGTFDDRIEFGQLGIARLALADVSGDGIADIVSGGASLAPRWHASNAGLLWDDAGPGLAGTNGVPDLTAYGDLSGGGLVTFALRDARPSATTILVIGVSELGVPFKGGVLVPFPDLFVSLPLQPNGAFVLHLTWPSGIPAGIPLWAQHWIPDPVALYGFAASNAVVATTQQ